LLHATYLYASEVFKKTNGGAGSYCYSRQEIKYIGSRTEFVTNKIPSW